MQQRSQDAPHLLNQRIAAGPSGEDLHFAGLCNLHVPRFDGRALDLCRGIARNPATQLLGDRHGFLPVESNVVFEKIRDGERGVRWCRFRRRLFARARARRQLELGVLISRAFRVALESAFALVLGTDLVFRLKHAEIKVRAQGHRDDGLATMSHLSIGGRTERHVARRRAVDALLDVLISAQMLRRLWPIDRAQNSHPDWSRRSPTTGNVSAHLSIRRHGRNSSTCN